MKKIILKSLEIFVLSVFILSVFLGCRNNTHSVSDSKPIESSINTPVQESLLTNEDTASSKQQVPETSKTLSSETSLIQSESTSLTTETVAIQDKSKFLTVADVEKISGEKGIKLIDYDPSIGAGGDLNFAKPDGTMFLLAQIQPKTLWDEWKKIQDFFDEPVSGVGEQAYNGPKGGGVHYIVFFTKGDNAFSVSSFFNLKDGGKIYFSENQLIELAKIMASR